MKPFIKWLIGIVLTLVGLSVPVFAGIVWSRFDYQQGRIEENTRDITSLKIEAGKNAERYDNIMKAVAELKSDLKEHDKDQRRKR